MSGGARYRRLFDNEWRDPAFKDLDADAKVIRLYVTAGPQTTSVGCFRLSTAVAVEDLGGTAKDFERRLDVVCQAFDWEWDPRARVIWVTNWFSVNPPASPNVVNSWAKLIKNVPDCDVKTHAIISIGQSLKDLPASFREPWRELSKTFPVSESQPQIRSEIRSETNQGAGIRDQGIREQRTGAARLAATTEDRRTFPEPDARMVSIARDVMQEAPRETTTEYLVDAFLHECRQRNVHGVNRATAITAIAKSQEGRTA